MIKNSKGLSLVLTVVCFIELLIVAFLGYIAYDNNAKYNKVKERLEETSSKLANYESDANKIQIYIYNGDVQLKHIKKEYSKSIKLNEFLNALDEEGLIDIEYTTDKMINKIDDYSMITSGNSSSYWSIYSSTNSCGTNDPWVPNYFIGDEEFKPSSKGAYEIDVEIGDKFLIKYSTISW